MMIDEEEPEWDSGEMMMNEDEEEDYEDEDE